MKNLLLLSACSLLFFGCNTESELASPSRNDIVRKIDKEHRNAPPGTVWIKDSIYMDMCEIRNVDYQEYTHWLKKYDSLNYEKELPDTTVWEEKNTFNEPYYEYYFSHPAYRKYPVVGVSYEQAVSFCRWRTERVKEFAKLISPKSKYADGYKNFKYYYRLPTKAEWEYAASAGLDSSHPFGFEKELKLKVMPNVVYKRSDDFGTAGRLNDVSDITSPVNFQKPNKFGLYGTIGNVAEMIINKGVSKGGSWMNSILDCEIKDSIKYEKPTAWLGFRCVCVVTK